MNCPITDEGALFFYWGSKKDILRFSIEKSTNSVRLEHELCNEIVYAFHYVLKKEFSFWSFRKISHLETCFAVTMIGNDLEVAGTNIDDAVDYMIGCIIKKFRQYEQDLAIIEDLKQTLHQELKKIYR